MTRTKNDNSSSKFTSNSVMERKAKTTFSPPASVVDCYAAFTPAAQLSCAHVAHNMLLVARNKLCVARNLLRATRNFLRATSIMLRATIARNLLRWCKRGIRELCSRACIAFQFPTWTISRTISRTECAPAGRVLTNRSSTSPLISGVTD